MRKIFSTAILVMAIVTAFAQEVEMADKFREEGKIYVTVVIIGIIIAGLFGYVFWIDKKTTRLEKKVKG